MSLIILEFLDITNSLSATRPKINCCLYLSTDVHRCLVYFSGYNLPVHVSQHIIILRSVLSRMSMRIYHLILFTMLLDCRLFHHSYDVIVCFSNAKLCLYVIDLHLSDQFVRDPKLFF